MVIGLVLLLPGPALAHPAPKPSGHLPRVVPTGPGSVSVVSQTPWVSPGGDFQVRFRVGGAMPLTQLGVSIAVYPCLTSVSDFDQSLSTSALASETPISGTSSLLPVDGLPQTGGVIDLALPVSVNGGSTSDGAGGFTVDLTAYDNQCGNFPSGVYPVRIQLAELAGGQTIAGFTTHLVVTSESPATERLRVAIVLPVQIDSAPTPAPTLDQLVAHPAGALTAPSPASVSALDAMVAALTSPSTSSVPVTVEASPLTLETLEDSGHSASVTAIASLAADPVHQFTSTPFAPVNASSLVDTGLNNELAMQVERGSQILDSTVLHTPVAQPPALGAWITNDPLDAGAIDQLAIDGYDQVVLPSGSVPSPPTDGSAAEPFTVTTAHGAQVTAIASDGDLSARFSDSSADAVLAAHQLVAELAQIYYEKPNDVTPRGVVAVAPNGWAADPAFVGALLSSLVGNPIIEPVTVPDLFSTLGAAASCHDDCRPLAVTSSSGLPVSAIHAQRRRLAGFSSAAIGPSARTVATELGDLVLAGESESLRPAQQSRMLDNASAALDAQLSELQVAGDRTDTLTSQQGTLPITIVSSTSYPVSGTLTLTSDKLLFPNGTTQWTQPVSLQLPNNVVYVKVRARTSGVFKVDVELRSPADGLLLSSGEVEVRSTATSVVGIVLSLGALTVLVVWWFRTSRKRRAQRRDEEPDDAEDREPAGTGAAQ